MQQMIARYRPILQLATGIVLLVIACAYLGINWIGITVVLVLSVGLPLSYLYIIYFRAIHLLKAGDVRGAVEHYDRVMPFAMPQHKAMLYMRRGHLRHTLGDTDGSIADYTAALQRMGEAPMLYAIRGSLYLANQDYQNALQDSNRLLQLLPQHGVGYANRAAAKLALGEVESAIDDCNAGLQYNRGDSTQSLLYNNLGTAYRMQGVYHEAMANYNLAMATHISEVEKRAIHPVIMTNQGLLYHLQQEYEQARVYFQQARHLNPTFRKSSVGLALARFKLGQIGEAQRLWQDVLSGEPRYRNPAYMQRDLNLPRAVMQDVTDLMESAGFNRRV